MSTAKCQSKKTKHFNWRLFL